MALLTHDSPGILIIAGEMSGDLLAGGLVRALRRRMPQARFFGIGGPDMRAAGVETLYDIRDMAVMGIVEVLGRFRFFHRVFHEMLGLLSARKPAAVILVDYPGFNLRFAARAHAQGIRVIYYVCPQVWAWNRRRIPKMARIIDRLIALFPFEKDVFAGTGLRVDFAGHPLVEETRRTWEEPAAALPWNGAPQVAVLPGSRTQEIQRLLPVMWRAAALVERKHPGASFLLAAPSEPFAAALKARVMRLGPGPSRWQVVAGQTRQVLRQAQAAWVASGTATLEAALMQCPMVIAYKLAWPTYFVGKAVVRIPRIGIVNIIAGRDICPELIQNAATPEALAAAIDPLLTDTPARQTMIEALKQTTESLDSGGAAERAADAVMAEMGG